MIYFKKKNPVVLKGSFNSNLFIVTVVSVDTSKAEIIKSSSSVDTDLCTPNTLLFYKEVRTDTKYSAVKNAHVLRDASAELAFLKQASGCEFIVKLAAEIDLGVKGVGLVLELAHCNFQEMYMKTDSSGIASVISPGLFGGRDNYVNFLRVIEVFLTRVATFLEQQSLVYCDWKFENILCFHSDVNAKNLLFKLSDFGSVLTADTPIVNPNNVNQLYSSPTFAKANREIVPTYADDHVSMCYMFYKLNHKRFPWEQDYNLSATPSADEIDFILVFTAFMKTCPLFKLKTHDVIYWPSGKIFQALGAARSGVGSGGGSDEEFILPRKRTSAPFKLKRLSN